MGSLCLVIVIAPLAAAIVAGLFGRQIGRVGAHSITVGAVGLSFFLSLIAFWQIVIAGDAPYNANVYTWLESAGIPFHIGFLIDELTATMMVVVTFVSWMVHIYTIGYMHDDPGYQRFFSYISLFTFSMLMLVMSNNFLQLFFGWEAVGLVSYLLIGFWYKRDTAIYANLKAFLVQSRRRLRVSARHRRHPHVLRLARLCTRVRPRRRFGAPDHRDRGGAVMVGDDPDLPVAVRRRHG